MQLKPMQPAPRAGLQPPRTPALVCHPDPAITSVTLTKGKYPLGVTVSYPVTHVALTPWHSAPNQQNLTLTAHNANTNQTYANIQRVPADMPARSVMLEFTTPMIKDAFDNFEFGGYLDLRIGYDPDILLDSNPRNDDSNAASNHFRLENSDILGFMKGPKRTQTYRP